MAFDLALEQFSGPIHKLLELVEERKLEITEISLAKVTNDFLAYLKTLEKIETPLLADFVVVASRLVLIKSKSLLPELALTDEEQGEIKDLENRLILFREFKPAMKDIASLWDKGGRQYARPYLLVRELTALDQTDFSGEGVKMFYPGASVTNDALFESLRKIFSVFQKLETEEQTVKEKIITVEEKIQEIIRRVSELGSTSFRHLSETKSRSEIITLFLAVLHLAREQLIFLEQKSYFSDILINAVEAEKPL
ncbi:MAG: segregation/condensation protein A [Patescibacteria group bacterium]